MKKLLNNFNRLVILFLLASAIITSCKKDDIGINNNSNNSYNNSGGNAVDTLGHSIQLWGMTASGGAEDSGMIYKINGDGSGFKTVFSFTHVSGTMPWGKLCKAPNGKLYGTTPLGGNNGVGTIFSFDPNGNIYKKILDFDLLTNGFGDPFFDLMLANNGKIYGANAIYIFSIDPVNDDFKILYRADASAGNISTMVQGKDNKLYGISYASPTGGVIYSFDITNNHFTNLYSFTKSTGTQPTNHLCAASDGNLYGLTYEGGANDQGVLFQFNPITKIYTVLQDFDGKNNGAYPLLRDHLEEVNHKLYGVTSSGGPSGLGVLFNYDLTTKAYTINQFFWVGSPVFGYPEGLLLSKSGLLYINGNDVDGAAILRYNPSDNSNKIIYHFSVLAKNIASMGDITEYN